VRSGLIGVAGTAWQVGLLRAGALTARGLRVPARNALLADGTVQRLTDGGANWTLRAMPYRSLSGRTAGDASAPGR
jgi:hypothetical protein